jgi:hypothetical protein
MPIQHSKASFEGGWCSGRVSIWNPEGSPWSAGDVGKTGVYRGESISLQESLSNSTTDGPGLDMHEIGTGVLALAGMTTISGAATGCGIEAERRLPVATVDDDAGTVAGSG